MAAAPRIELDADAPDTVDGRQIRAVAFQECRMAYVRGTLAALGRTPDGRRALVMGSGRGLLARGLAGLGFDVTAVDPSAAATRIARAAHPHDHPAVAYRTAPAEEPGLADAAFDLAYYADTLEITPDPDRVLAEAARLLRPGGVLVYDTVNRTPLSRLVYLGAFQRLPLTRIMPTGRYTAARLRTPAELAAALDRHGLRNEDICDFRPRDPRGLIRATVARRRGRITDDQIPPLADFVRAPDARPRVTYLGYALKG
ncbi:methyltransferase domain-containing protein [Streptomyces botrytidirepellens]|uniref:Methyltransferase domain-containing protein n=1 Tax=Streptomyces botrytidirepellens TaxID=2486417 RepID=A0A3M8T355_9ACTN|nr:methyltransferase domain-containing protein [Streptomyces botrytidirepellens]RNF88008.1 methyltransferase domain-containing protein [Streptomyces botrytidirepellens]